ncbi:hypothetical protein [Streptomyces sp. NPDC085540]|uniref:hypothetical protein n=1 Tax=Streptomyces sp. NPDC085540 TaxID=3365730 RepID=UPI0037CFC0A5
MTAAHQEENRRNRSRWKVLSGWLGKIEGLRVSLTGAESKISQIDSSTPNSPVLLGLPAPRPTEHG